MEFFNNSINDSLKFKLNSDGVDLNRIEPRLILTTKSNENYFFIGEIKNGVCEFDIPELKLYEKGDYGKIKFEIISEDETYFPVWEDKFEIKTKATIKLEEMVSEIVKTSSKPKITSDLIIEKTAPIKEKKREENPFDELTERLSTLKIEEDDEEEMKKIEKVLEKKHPQIGSIKKFGGFRK